MRSSQIKTQDYNQCISGSLETVLTDIEKNSLWSDFMLKQHEVNIILNYIELCIQYISKLAHKISVSAFDKPILVNCECIAKYLFLNSLPLSQNILLCI